LIVVYVAGAVFGQAAVQGQIQQRVSGAVGPQIGNALSSMIQNASVSGGGLIATALGVVGLVFSATTTFAQLQSSLNRAWGIERDESGVRSFATKRFTSFLMIVGISILVLVFLALSTAVSALTRMAGLPLPAWAFYVFEVLLSWVVFAACFAAIFKVLPDAKIEWKDVRVGGAVTAILFVIGKFLIGMYLAHSTTANAYGAAGSLALLLLWTYYSAMIFLLGAEFTEAWAESHGREVEPEEGAVYIGASKGDRSAR
jgi:membrane protein